MNAKQARMHVNDHKMLLLYPKLEDVTPFIERSAKMGGTSVFYGVDENIQPSQLQDLIGLLEKEGYEVSTSPTNGLIALEIRW